MGNPCPQSFSVIRGRPSSLLLGRGASPSSHRPHRGPHYPPAGLVVVYQRGEGK